MMLINYKTYRWMYRITKNVGYYNKMKELETLILLTQEIDVIDRTQKLLTLLEEDCTNSDDSDIIDLIA